MEQPKLTSTDEGMLFLAVLFGLPCGVEVYLSGVTHRTAIGLILFLALGVYAYRRDGVEESKRRRQFEDELVQARRELAKFKGNDEV